MTKKAGAIFNALLPFAAAAAPLLLQYLPNFIEDRFRSLEGECAVVIEQGPLQPLTGHIGFSTTVTLHGIGAVPPGDGVLTLSVQQGALKSVRAVLGANNEKAGRFLGKLCPMRDDRGYVVRDTFCRDFDPSTNGFVALSVSVPSFGSGYNPTYEIQMSDRRRGITPEIRATYRPDTQTPCPARNETSLDRIWLLPPWLGLILAVGIFVLLKGTQRFWKLD